MSSGIRVVGSIIVSSLSSIPCPVRTTTCRGSISGAMVSPRRSRITHSASAVPDSFASFFASVRTSSVVHVLPDSQPAAAAKSKAKNARDSIVRRMRIALCVARKKMLGSL